MRECVRACMRVCVSVNACACVLASARASVCTFVCAYACSLARIHIHTHTQAFTLVTTAETTQWSPGLFELLVGQSFSNLRPHHSFKTRFPVLLLDSHMASLLYTGTLTTEECLMEARSSSILTSLRVENM